MRPDVSYVSSRTQTASPLLAPCDPIAAAIALVRPRAVIDPALRAAGAWAVRFDAVEHVRIGAVVRGECWLTIEAREPVLLREGDMYLLTNTAPYLLASHLDAKSITEQELWAGVDGSVARIGAEVEEDTSLCGGYFSFDESNAPLLIHALPPLVHVRADDPRSRGLINLTDLLSAELEGNAVGRSLVMDHLVRILFIEVLRAHAEQTDRPRGWLGALGGDGIGAALRAMHGDVAHRWTLPELATISRMSRSTFASTFRRQVGTTPGEYLIRWRMSLARDALRCESHSISELAFAIGYESESAFSTAFRRVVGVSPRQFRDDAKRPAPPPCPS